MPHPQGWCRYDDWLIKIGRGLDFYQKPATWHEIGVHDLALRRCLETKVDVFRTNLAPEP